MGIRGVVEKRVGKKSTRRRGKSWGVAMGGSRRNNSVSEHALKRWVVSERWVRVYVDVVEIGRRAVEIELP